MNDNNKTYIAMYFGFDMWGTPHYVDPYVTTTERETIPSNKIYYGNDYVLYNPYTHKIMGNNPTILQKHIKHMAFHNAQKMNAQIQYFETCLKNLNEESSLKGQYQASLKRFKIKLAETYYVYKLLSIKLKILPIT